MQTFNEYVDRKQRESQKHLKIIQKLLESQDMQVEDYTKEEQPYIFVRSPSGASLSFEGIRIYKIGDVIAYKVQREPKTHPYGKAYPLNLEEMFSDFMSDNIKELEAGKRVIKHVAEEVKEFFQKSVDAESDIRQTGMDVRKDPFNRVALGGDNYTDYGNMVRNIL